MVGANFPWLGYYGNCLGLLPDWGLSERLLRSTHEKETLAATTLPREVIKTEDEKWMKCQLLHILPVGGALVLVKYL